MSRCIHTLQVVFFVVLIAVAGCSESRARVSGKVTYKDKPLPGGNIVFSTEDDQKHGNAEIQADGTYVATNVPFGKVRVAVSPAAKGISGTMPKGVKKHEVPGDSPAAAVYGKKGTEYVDIPMHYRDVSKSNITLTVDKSDQTFDIPLKDSK